MDSSLSPTPHDEAADPNHSVWVSASAGTGKTTALTRRVAELLKAGAEPEQVVCLTYTKAAAAEMRRRVLDRLAAGPHADEHAHTLRRLYVRLLEKADALSIHTIHGLCQKLLQLFPVEAGVPPHFEVLDDTTAKEYIRAARLSLIAGGGSPAIRAALERVIMRMGDARLADLLSDVTGANSRVPEWLERVGDDLEKHVFAHLDITPGDTSETERSILVTLTPARLDLLRALISAWRQGGKDEQKQAERLETWLNLPDDAARSANLDLLVEVFFTQTREARARLFTKATVALYPHLVEPALQEQRLCLQFLERDACVRLARQTADLLVVCNAVWQLYRDRKEAAAVLDFRDLLDRAWKLLHRSEMAPWVLYKLDRDLHHLLVDEAQDTNRLQWALMDALTAEFFAGAGQVARNRTLCVVGDEKQSIFGFQGAEPAIFGNRRAWYAEKLKSAELPFREVGLHLSFRSTAPILQLVDAVFEEEDARRAVQSDETPIAHGIKREGQPGYVEIWPLFQNQGDDEAEPEGWKLPLARKAQRAAHQRVAEAVAKTIRQWLDEGRVLVSTGKPIAPGDILILLRSRSHMIHHLSAELRRVQVPTSGIDRFDLMEHIAAKDLVSLMRFVLNPLDDLTLAEVLKSPFIGVDEETLLTLCRHREGSLWAHLEQQAGQTAEYAAWLGWLRAAREAAEGQAPLAFLHHVLDRLGGRRRIYARLGYEAADVLETFLEQVMQYERLHTPSLQGVVHWLEQGSVQVVRDAAQPGDYVRLMTVHGSKGLQAPIVFLPDTGPARTRPSSLAWPPGQDRALCYWTTQIEPLPDVVRQWKAEAGRQDQAEDLRLLYVALTRAADYLIVAGADTRRKGKKEREEGECWHKRIREACAKLPGVMEFQAPGFPDETTGLRYANAPQEVFEAHAPASASGYTSVPELPAFAIQPLTTNVRNTWVRPSANVKPSGSGNRGSRARGQAIHQLLQYLPRLSSEQWQEAGSRMLGAQFGFMAQAERARWLEEALGVMRHPAYAAFFLPPSQAEVALTAQWDGAMVSAQIDRILIEPREITCLEYKTTPRIPLSPAEADPGHLHQVEWYRALLQKRFPERLVRVLLLYTAGPKIVEITG